MTFRAVEHRAHFYPGHIPPAWWVRQALMVYDSFSTDLRRDELDAGQTLMPGEEREYLSPDETWLVAEGFWVPSPPLEHGVSIDEVRPTVEARLRDEIGNDDFYKYIATMIVEKVRRFERASNSAKLRLIPCTNNALIFDALHSRVVVGSDSGADGHRLLLDGLLPVPRQDMSFPDIISFRDRYSDELLSFRIELDRLIDDIAMSDNGLRAITGHRQAIEQAVTSIERAARARRLHLIRGTATVAIAGGLASQIPAETLHWVFDGVGIAVAVGLMSYRSHQGKPLSPYSYLVRARTELLG